MIEIRNLGRQFEDASGEIWPVKEVNISIEGGEFVSVVGRSGSGKSTLLKMLGGLLKPTKGNILIDGVDLYGMNEKELAGYRCDSIGFIFQDYFLEEQYTVYQNLEIVLMISNIPGKDRQKKIEKALDKVGMLYKKESYVKVLSGGEKQRVCIARAIVNNPGILLADEPCGNLDYENGQIIMRLLRAQSDEGKTVVLITHNLEDAKMTDRIIKIKDGCVVDNED
ncbi:MAG: ABC transporter ATP-binding protein [Butyrivibrio sp.]